MAAEFIYYALKKKGLKMIGKPFRAGVAGWKGPLTEGDTDKAYEFGKELASGLSVPA